MAKIDKLREEASEIRSKMFYILGLMMMFLAGFGSLYLKLVDGVTNGLIAFGMSGILIFLQICAIIYFRYRKIYRNKLNELEKE